MTYRPDLNDPVLQRVARALHPLDIDDDTDAIQREGQRRAAVLMPLVERDAGWQVLLTQRPDHLPRHAGQISFPGGRIEAGETPAQAALRETHEEVGIDPSHVTLLGRIDSFNAVSQFRVTPFIGVFSPRAKIVACPSEVADIFEVPLAFFMDVNNHKRREVFFDGADHVLYDMPYTEPSGLTRNIWGMTAMMLYRLYHLIHSPPR